MDLNPDAFRRYARQLILPEVGPAGQQKLRAARVLCLGAGGLGSPVALYLAAAGVGRLGLVDFDVVDLSNLQRQILHGTPDHGRPKVESARDALARLNPDVEVLLHPVRLSAANALDLIRDYDVVVDGTDNFPARYLANDACVFLGKPNIYGAIYRWEGQASVFAPHRGGPCYRCLYPEPPPPGAAPACVEAGVMGVMPGIIGCLQATETIKWILGCGASLLGRLLVVDALDMRFRELRVQRDPGCPICGEHPTIRKLQEEMVACAPAPPTTDAAEEEVTVHDLRRALDDPTRVITVVDVREPAEWALADLPGTRKLPLSELPRRAAEFDRSGRYYLYCRSGARSLQAARWLRSQGVRAVWSVRGGLLAWAEELDPQMPRY